MCGGYNDHDVSAAHRRCFRKPSGGTNGDSALTPFPRSARAQADEVWVAVKKVPIQTSDGEVCPKQIKPFRGP
jgi:hypothetical protein